MQVPLYGVVEVGARDELLHRPEVVDKVVLECGEVVALVRGDVSVEDCVTVELLRRDFVVVTRFVVECPYFVVECP